MRGHGGELAQQSPLCIRSRGHVESLAQVLRVYRVRVRFRVRVMVRVRVRVGLAADR